ncbi:MAG: hypothetical protein DHS20C18_29810 [Saprospiraceae bacterium]|nr:MAG: hypothetical protein DHS20C18_29810 [Saprospiraceae bacterium]
MLFFAACKVQEEAKSVIASPKAGKPNIIFIMADDLGYGDLGSYGQKVIKTPHLDRMATEGIRFTQCYAGSTVCAPSRSVLLTGKHTGHTTVRGNTGVGGVVGLGGAAGRIPLQDSDTTIAEVLKPAGYITGMTGKWGLGEPNTSGHPSDQGFDEFFGFLNQRRAHSYFPPYIWKDTVKITLENNQKGAQKEYVHDLFSDYAIDFINRYQDTTFFLYLPYTIPHDEYQIPDLGIYADSLHWKEEERIYAAMVSRMDADVGRIFQVLKDLKIDEQTIVFFCSDNGAAQLWEGRFDSSGPLRGRKRDLYEGGIRTPMIVRQPGVIPAGLVSDYPWHFVDVLPTLAELAGAVFPVDIDGHSVCQELGLKTKNEKKVGRAFYWEFHENGFQQAVRWGKWKGLRFSLESEWELYDLETDPGEQRDLSKLRPEIVVKLNQIAATERVPSPYFPVEKQSNKKTIFIIGDSTVKKGKGKGEDGMWGWGDFLGDSFDTTKIQVVNLARGGRSSKTFITEGLWDNLLTLLQPGDFVLMQFGHNDGGPINTGKARGSLKGDGEKFQEVIMEGTGKKEKVHTYGWYMRKYIADSKTKGAIPVVLSMIPRNRWEKATVIRASADYGKWAKQAAMQAGAWFIDLNEIVAKKYETIGQETVDAQFFLEDHTHTTEAGAQLNANSVVDGIQRLRYCQLKDFLKNKAAKN